MHVTVAFSHKPVPWHRLTPHGDDLHIVGDQRAVIPLGDKGATVLQFFHPNLHRRWQEFLSHGASWEHDGFRPHVTITYEPHHLDLKHIKPYHGPIILGPETFAPVVVDWEKKIREIPAVAENRRVLARQKPGAVKYSKSIMENNNMTESLASLLMKNIDLILEAYNVDEQGNLVEVNRKKVQESDEVFHNYFVKSMNKMFRTINENDPIMHNPDSMMDPMNGMHRMGDEHMGHMGGMGDEMGMGGDPMGDMGGMGDDTGMGHEMGMGRDHMGAGHMGVDDTLGDMAMDDMHAGGMQSGMRQMGGGMGAGGSAGGGMGGGMGGGPAMESAESDFDWVFNEEADLDVNSLFDLPEGDEDEEGEDDQLNEFGMHHHDDMMDDGMGMGGSMDMGGGANDYGGDMGGMSGGGMSGGGMGGDDMGGDMMGGGMGGDDMMGGDDDMVTIHGTTDGGGEFEFSFDPDTLGFGGGDMGDEGDMGGGDEFGGGEEHHSHESHGGGEHHDHDEPGMGEDEEEPPVAEATMVKKGKPGKGQRGPKTARMGIVPADPATDHAAPFPTPQGSRQKRK